MMRLFGIAARLAERSALISMARFCARLAALQLKLLLGRIVARIPDIRPTSKPRYLRSIWFNAIIDMPVSFIPVCGKVSRSTRPLAASRSPSICSSQSCLGAW